MDNLKDVILQTLQDLEKNNDDIEETTQIDENLNKEYLINLRDKILVLFEGLQSPNITDIDKKLDLTINFLEYILSDIDDKLSN